MPGGSVSYQNVDSAAAPELGLLPEEIGLCGSRTAVRRTFLPQSAPKGRMIEGNMEEMAQTLANELRKRVNQK